MELKGSKTEANLRKAFLGELQAHSSYLYFAEAARAAGFDQVADVFLATAKNEAEHAEHYFKFLGGVGDTRGNLRLALAREHEEAVRLYPEAAQTAEEEGFTEIADFFRRMGTVEESHERNYRQLLETLEQGGDFKERTVGHSEVYMAQMMLPDQANPAGFVHGGELMKLMDNAAGAVAARHSRSNVVTAMVEDITFHSPVRIADLVMIHARMTFTSRSSMEVQIEVDAESLLAGKRQRALTAYFIMVALDAQGRATEVPPLIISTEEEQGLYSSGLARYQARKARAEKSRGDNA